MRRCALALAVLSVLLFSATLTCARSPLSFRYTPARPAFPSSASYLDPSSSSSLEVASSPSIPPPTVPAFDPVANPAAIVTANHARFTVLTPHLVRLEYSATDSWQDAATWVAIDRNLPVPAFKQSSNATHLTITTTGGVSVYWSLTTNSSFNRDNILVAVSYPVMVEGSAAMQTANWSAINKQEVEGNLYGTFRTLDGDSSDETNYLDCANSDRSDQHCTYGVISRNGYALVDDTHMPSYDNSEWPWVVPKAWTAPPADQCMLDDSHKRDCGFSGITQQQCEQKECCWAPASSSEKAANTYNNSTAAQSQWGVPGCFYSSQATQDLYLFGHGHDYTAAMQDFTKLSGDIPLPPRYTFGVFFSRYWAYASYEEKQIVREYAQHDIPLDVLVVDMDWHITFYKLANEGKQDQAGENIGWSGFTFDQHLFVNYSQFLHWCKTLGLRNTLNLHPASGIQPWEETYPQMAEAMGIDPSSGRYVPFNETDKRYESNWMNLTLAPLEKAGIDLWWLDWQQGEDWVQTIPGFNPTFWLNYVFFTNPYHWGVNGKRNALLHRWGGLGNHRYQIGFSGDVVPGWSSLTFQPYFTATAANVGYTFWSHDLGGHTAPSEPQLYTRWLQWGAFSPVFRTHCTKNVENDRRIYTYPWSYYNTLRQFTKLRQSLVPYIYTSARHVHDLSRALVRPVYYDFPENDMAYSRLSTHTYFYGSQFFIAPVTQPVSESTNMTTWTYWLPPCTGCGAWINFFTSERLSSAGQVVTANYTLWEMPAFVREGAIIPLLSDSTAPLSQAQVTPDRLRLIAFVGQATHGTGELYEDNGDDNGYRQGQYRWTTFSFGSSNPNFMLVAVNEGNGSFPGFVQRRTYEVELRGVQPPGSVCVSVSQTDCRLLEYVQFNDVPLAKAGKMSGGDSWGYDGATMSVVVTINTPQPTNTPLQVVLRSNSSLYLPAAASDLPGTIARFVHAKATLDNQWGHDTVFQDDYPTLLNVASYGERMTYDPSSVSAVLSAVAGDVMRACREVSGNITGLDAAVQTQLVAQLCPQ